MGNLCGKPSPASSSTNHPSAFSQPGRTLTSAPPPQSGTAPLPASAKPQPQPPRTLGATRSDTSDARAAAARAAEERAKAQQPKGKLGAQLAKERGQTRTNTLENASRDERRAREADQGREARSWD